MCKFCCTYIIYLAEILHVHRGTIEMLLFVLMLSIPVNKFKICRDSFLSSWVEPVLSSGSRTEHSESLDGESRNEYVTYQTGF